MHAASRHPLRRQRIAWIRRNSNTHKETSGLPLGLLLALFADQHQWAVDSVIEERRDDCSLARVADPSLGPPSHKTFYFFQGTI